MSLLSMLTMEFVENIVDMYLTKGKLILQLVPI